MAEPTFDDLALRADIRRVVGMLGETLTRQEGAELLELVEQVRSGTRVEPAATAAMLDDVDVETANELVRAFLAYFHLANVVEQVHRGRALRSVRQQGGWLARVADAIEVSGIDRRVVADKAARLAVRPVFTAHPTEAARRTTLARLRGVADLLELDRDARADRQLAEIIDLLWLTDDLRIARPEPIDEARNAIYYFDELYRRTVPHVLDELDGTLRRLGVDLPPIARPLSFGTWIGGDRDGNPNVTPEVTLDVIRLQHDHAIRDAIEVVDGLRQDLAVSTRLVEVSPSLLRSLEADLAALPEVEDRYLRLNAEEPYRLKAICIRQKLLNTQDPNPRLVQSARSGPGLSRHRRAAGRPRRHARLAAGQPGRAGGDGPAGSGHSHGGRVRSATGDHGRSGARRVPPPGRGRADRTARPALFDADGRGATRRARPRARQPETAGRDATAARRVRAADLPGLCHHSRGTGQPGSRRGADLHRVDDPRRRRRPRRGRAGPAGRPRRHRRRAWPASASFRCSRRWPSCAAPTGCSTIFSRSPPTDGSSSNGATSRR